MGLDIVLFDEGKVRIGLIEIPNNLHDAIFASTSNWSSYSYLKKVKDYYKTNIYLNLYEISCFVEDLRQIRTFIDSMHHSSLDRLIQALSGANIKAIHIAGD
ncbi:hypothetical protein QE450_003953 [Paenibacillus sp. SORGH_AS306]|uniref:hypothetical protein n=1 Tax=unclassified Paenibacillus TaxID=185978 RepID=UPI00277E885C|nr:MULTISPECIES: hypothetical protein [unclassified Paenibacillus]MDQ1236455.1 hypothetical protein [Paenibacillus sp. SORGH_AS_0306]MDR6108808.1 hypothetical protein [Paenibacillus sp. SORGH_AS_0338]